MDVPCGYITRIRRTEAIEHPSCNENYISKMLLLLELALAGRSIRKDTLMILNTARKPLRVSDSTQHWFLPPTFMPSPSSTFSSASALSSTSSLPSQSSTSSYASSSSKKTEEALICVCHIHPFMYLWYFHSCLTFHLPSLLFQMY